MTKAFLSSTAKDLAAHREATASAINRLDDFRCIRMEDFGARPRDPDKVCRQLVRSSDVFVGLAGHLFGSLHSGSGLSYTQREYEEAETSKKPMLMFVASGTFRLPANLREPDDLWQRQIEFRRRINTAYVRGEFTTPDELAGRVVEALRNWERTARLRSKADRSVTVRIEDRSWHLRFADRFAQRDPHGLILGGRLAFRDGVLEVQGDGFVALESTYGQDVRVAVEVRFLPRLDEPQHNWLGIEVRGSGVSLVDGYLVHLRESGGIDLASGDDEYRTSPPVTEGSIIYRPDPEQNLLQDSEWRSLTATAAGEQLLIEYVDPVTDKTIREERRVQKVRPGTVRLKALRTQAQFRNLRVWVAD